MKTTLLAASFAALSSLALVTGCGCDANTNSFREPATSSVQSTTALRTVACKGDRASFTLDVSMDDDTAMEIVIPSSVVVGQDIPLDVPASDGADVPVTQTASDARSNVRFSLTSGAYGNSIDSSPVNAVVVQVDSMPAADRQDGELAVSLTIQFFDGRMLNEQYSAPVSTALGCSAALDSAPKGPIVRRL